MKSFDWTRLACVAALAACTRAEAPAAQAAHEAQTSEMQAQAEQASQAAPGRLTAATGYRVLPRTAGCASGYAATSVRYTVTGADPLEQDGWPHLVLEEKTSIRRCDDQQGPGQGEVSVAARPADHPEAAPVWTIRHGGDEGTVVDSLDTHALYRVTTHGAYGVAPVHAYFSLYDGQALFTANNPLLLLDMEAFGRGFVAVHNVHAALPPGAPDDSTLVAVVAFGMPGDTIQRVAVRCPSNLVRLEVLELVARDTAGRIVRNRMLDGGIPLDERAGVAIHMRWVPDVHGEPEGDVTIPIEHGRMAVQRARVSPDFSVVAMTAR